MELTKERQVGLIQGMRGAITMARAKEESLVKHHYRFTPLEPGKYEAHLLVSGIPCPGRMGVLTGRPGNWQAEWVDGSRVGTFDTLQDGAKALENYRYHI